MARLGSGKITRWLRLGADLFGLKYLILLQQTQPEMFRLLLKRARFCLHESDWILKNRKYGLSLINVQMQPPALTIILITAWHVTPPPPAPPPDLTKACADLNSGLQKW